MGSPQLTAGRRLIGYAALGLLSLAGSLLLVTLMPLVFGWRPSVVLSGSMAPSLEPGDVVIAKPVRPGDLRPGQVIRFGDPAEPDRYLVHRIVEIKSDGSIVTKGDANATRDSSTVTTAEITGTLRLRVPWVGLPRLWAVNGAYSLLVTTVGAALLTWPLTWLNADDGVQRLRLRPGRHRQS
jgi:signal peptidase